MEHFEETSNPQKHSLKRFALPAIAVLLVVGVVAVYQFDLLSKGEGEVIVRVGNEEITRQDAEIRERQLLVRASEGQLSVPQDALFDRAIDDLITESLLYQDALRQGFTADPNEVEVRYNKAEAAFDSEVAFLERMQENLLTPEKFRENIARQIVLFAYLEELKRLAIQEQLDQVVGGKTPDGTSVTVTAERTQLTQDEINEISENKAEALKSEFEVEVFLD